MIHGAALHALLVLPVENNSYRRTCDAQVPQGALLENMQGYWKSVKLLIIDEMSMVSDDEMLQLINFASAAVLSAAWDPFRQCGSVLTGDLHQEPPVKGRPPIDATMSWRQFFPVIFHGNHRAADDPDFAALLSGVRVGPATPDDIAQLTTRFA